MRLASHRVGQIVLRAEELRVRFPALRRPARIAIVQRLLQEVGVAVYRAPFAHDAEVLGAGGAFVIGLRNTVRGTRQTKLLLHELAHILLHLSESAEPERQLGVCLPGDPREAEAELLARLLYHGPEATPQHPAIAPVVAAITAYGMRRRAPAQIPLALPEPPRPRGASTARPAPIGNIRRTARLFSHARTSENEDFQRVDYDRVRRATKFIDVSGLPWLVADYRVAAGSGRPVRERDFTKPGIKYRLFVSPAGRRCLYTFPDRRERREHLVKHLDRQLAKARPLPMQQTWRTLTAQPLESQRSRR